jgi:type I restriction enzyme, R subunit
LAKWREKLLIEERFQKIKTPPCRRRLPIRYFRIGRPACAGISRGYGRMNSSLLTSIACLSVLLSKDRLLEFVRFFILFDKKIGKVAARYQQAPAADMPCEL